ncbi:MAG TPA: serine/threonine-protein kinase [Gemmataceae bacterium]|nr:serine/threonine-protein kinase [Gemmataceae bacterium]
MLSPTELITFLSRNQFLSSAQGESLTRERQRFVSSVQLCGELVQRGWLTPYQQAQLLSGNGDKLIIASYRIQCPLGEGGMGVVYKAIQPKLDRVVALKVIRPQVLASRPEVLSRFQREAKAIAQLNHPNVVILFDADEVNGTHYIAMEYVEGQTLEKMVRTQGPMSIRQACEYMRQSALGLQHSCEVGLIHRDIKPSNILVSQKLSPGGNSSMRMPRPTLVTLRDRSRMVQSGGSTGKQAQHWGQVKILDMGLARLTESLDEDKPTPEYTPLTRAGALLGTPDFISPEQARDARQVDIRADIYSLGCTFYYILTGKPPFPGGTDVQKLIQHQNVKPHPIDELRPGIPHEVTRILMRMMEKRPEDRYPTPRHLADALEAYLNPVLPSTPVPGGQVPEAPPVPDTPAPPPAKAPAPAANNGTAPPTNAFPTVNPVSNPMRDTMPMPPGLAEALAIDASGQTRQAGSAAILVTRPRLQVPAHKGVVTGVAFSRDGRYLATSGIEGRVRLWDLSGQHAREAGVFPRPGAEFHSVIFAPHDDYLIVGGAMKGTAHVWRWDWKDGRVGEWGAYQGDKVTVSKLAFTADGRRFAAGIGPFLVSWKINGRQANTGEILKGHGGLVQAIAWTRDGKRVASAGVSKNIIIWGFGWLRASQKAKFRSHTEVLHGLAFSPDGHRLAAGGTAKTIAVWNPDSPKPETVVSLVGHSDHVRHLQYLPDGTLMSIGHSGHVIIWDAAAGLELTEFHLSERMATAVCVAPDGKRVATGSADGRVGIFETVRVPSAVTVGE